MDQRLRTDHGYNLQLLKDLDCEEDWLQMPIINPIQGVPTRLVGFNYALTSKEFDKAVHFYLDDYQFERVWRSPERYIKILRKIHKKLSQAQNSKKDNFPQIDPIGTTDHFP